MAFWNVCVCVYAVLVCMREVLAFRRKTNGGGRQGLGETGQIIGL